MARATVTQRLFSPCGAFLRSYEISRHARYRVAYLVRAPSEKQDIHYESSNAKPFDRVEVRVSPAHRGSTATFETGGPLIELERPLLSNVTWTNANGGDWDTPSNWSNDQVPGPNDNVTISLSSAETITHSSSNNDRC